MISTTERDQAILDHLKDRLLELLNPKPVPYQDLGPGADLSGYLPTG